MSDPAAMPPAATSDAPVSFWLSAVSGYVDTAGFILLAGIFTAHVTGNLVLAGATLAGGGGTEVWPKLLLLPVFAGAVVGASRLGRWSAARGYRPITAILVAEASALGVFLAAGILHDSTAGPWGSPASLFLLASPAVVAMGFQNALNRELLGGSPPTTMMTGNFTQLALDVFSLGWPDAATDMAPVRRRVRKIGTALAGFVGGAVSGALGVALCRYWCIAVPVVALAVLGILHGTAIQAPPRQS